MTVPIPILTDNAEMLASAYRALSAAQRTSKTNVEQKGATLTLSSWKDGRVYRNSLSIKFRDEVHHDSFSLEVRDLTALFVRDDRLVVQADGIELLFAVVDDLSFPAGPCPCCHDRLPPSQAPWLKPVPPEPRPGPHPPGPGPEPRPPGPGPHPPGPEPRPPGPGPGPEPRPPGPGPGPEPRPPEPRPPGPGPHPPEPRPPGPEPRPPEPKPGPKPHRP